MNVYQCRNLYEIVLEFLTIINIIIYILHRLENIEKVRQQYRDFIYVQVISDGESKINKETTADRGKLTTLLLPTIVKTKKDRFEDIELTTAEIPTSHLKPGIVHVDYSSYYLSALKPIKDCKNG